MSTTALTTAVALSNPSGASPAKFSMDTGDTDGNTFTNGPTKVVLARNDHVADPQTVTVLNSAGVAQTAVSLAAGEQVVLGPFDPDTYGTTVTVDPGTTDIKLRLIDIAATLSAKVAVEAAKHTVDTVWDAAGTEPAHKRALRRVSHKMAVALRRIAGVNPDPMLHDNP